MGAGPTPSEAAIPWGTNTAGTDTAAVGAAATFAAAEAHYLRVHGVDPAAAEPQYARHRADAMGYAWRSLTPAEQTAYLAADPGAVDRLERIPARHRDLAYQQIVEQARADADTLERAWPEDQPSTADPLDLPELQLALGSAGAWIAELPGKPEMRIWRVDPKSGEVTVVIGVFGPTGQLEADVVEAMAFSGMPIRMLEPTLAVAANHMEQRALKLPCGERR